MNNNFFHNILSLNWSATLGVNYAVGGLPLVFRMPIKIYGKMKWHINGEIVLPSNAIRNTVIIGSPHEDYTASSGRAEMNIEGTWRIKGITRLGHDCFIGVRKGGVLETGKGCVFGRDTQIHCSKKIVFGNDILTGELYVTDCAEHQIISKGEKKNMMGEVLIGNGTYLGFRCMLLKGCIIPPHSVVASGAVCTKDYSKEGREKLFIAGIPAQVKTKDVTIEL